MRDETAEKITTLRYGYTTGSCATATCLAAATHLLKPNSNLQTIQITLPKKQQVTFQLEYCKLTTQGAIAATCKDAGDDPDVTHQAIIFSEVRLRKAVGIVFRAGEGVGMVTRKGLAIPIGEPAINPVPRQMIQQHLQALAKQQQYHGGFEVIIGVENGIALAKKTMNPRLGIVNGLSILGTTGIVRPFSCSAYIASIHQGIDVAKANNIQHIAACTGSGSEAMITKQYALPDMALIEMGDFVGAVLKHLKKSPINKVSLVGGFGKISKLAAGHLDLHSRKSSIDFKFLGDTSGADQGLRAAILSCNTSLEALQLCQQANINLGDLICQKARQVAYRYTPKTVTVEVWAIDRTNQAIGYAS